MSIDAAIIADKSQQSRFIRLLDGCEVLTVVLVFDTIIYVLDPNIASRLIVNKDYNDDYGTDLNAKLTTTLVSGRRYLIIYSAFNPSQLTESRDLTLTIQKELF